MTIPTQQSSQIFLGNGVTTAFDFSFVGADSDFINVTYTDADGNSETLLPAQYTIFLNPAATGALWGIGGTVTYPIVGSPIANGTSLTVARILPLVQDDSISNQGAFAPSVIETALDTLEMQIQQTSARSGLFRGTWITDAVYNLNDTVIDGANGTDTGNYYVCAIANTSDVWATDLSAGYWTLFINVASITADVADAAASAAAALVSENNAAASASTATTQAGIATTQAGISTAQAVISTTQATNAAASAVLAANYAAALSATSVTSNLIAIGAKTFTTQTGKQFIAGQFLIIASAANDANYMHGQVTSYTGSTLIMNITDIGGSGTFADWNISVSGTQGATGSGAVFNTITSGTNTIAAMVVGTGASLSTSGSGTIAATSIPATGITGTTTVAQGGTGLATLTANNVILGNGTSNVQFVAPGTTGNLLTSNGTTWGSSPATYVLLNTQTASNSVSIVFNNTYLTSAYKLYIFEIINLVVGTNNSIINVTASIDNGSNYLSSYPSFIMESTSNANTFVGFSQSAATTFELSHTTSNGTGTGQNYSGTIKLYNPSDTTVYKALISDGALYSSNPYACFEKGVTFITTLSAVNTIKFAASSGNIASGTFKLYGVL